MLNFCTNFEVVNEKPRGCGLGRHNIKLKNINSVFYLDLLILIFQFGPYFTPYAFAKLPTFNPTDKYPNELKYKTGLPSWTFPNVLS